jgi:Lrp/AsnC ligand binding domain
VNQPEGPPERAGTRKEIPAMRAYVLVQTDTPRRHVAERLRTLPGIEFAEDVSGPYDALALARSDPDGDGFEGVLDQIRGLPGVIHALPAPLAAPVAAPVPLTVGEAA